MIFGLFTDGFVVFIIAVFSIIGAVALAGSKRRDKFGWGALAFCFGPLAVLLLACFPVAQPSQATTASGAKHGLPDVPIDEWYAQQNGVAWSEFRKCPFCAEEIRSEAIKCKHCGSEVEAIPKPAPVPPPPPVPEAPTGQVTPDTYVVRSAGNRPDASGRMRKQ